MTQERKTILILEVEAPKPVGKKGTIKYGFKAKEGEKSYSYFTFSQTIADAIKVGESIEADVDTTEREYEGNTYIDRKLMQIYRDGQPLHAKTGSGDFRPRQSSPEERASIEAQVAYKGAIELMVAGKADAQLSKAALTWALSRLQPQGQKVIGDLWPEELKRGEKQVPPPTNPPAVSKPQEKSDEKPGGQGQPPSLLTPRQKEAVLAIARQHGWSLEELNQELKQLNYPALDKLTIAQASGFITWAGKEATKGGLI